LVYLNGKLVEDYLLSDLTLTWKYYSILRNQKHIDYGMVYCEDKPLSDVCPDWFYNDWDYIVRRYKAYLTSIKEGKIDLGKVCIYELVPQSFWKEYCEGKNIITKHVVDTHRKTNYHQLLIDVVILFQDLKKNRLNIDQTKAKEYGLSNYSDYIEYSLFKSITGRISSKKGSFPILHMKKTYRDVIKPHNDVFVEIDYNAAEARVLLGLAGKEQQQIDIHEWNRQQIYGNDITREQSKKEFFAWLYGSEIENKKLDLLYDKKSILDKYYDGKKVKTLYDKEIETDTKHALNYIMQSTCSYMLMEQVLKVNNYLQSKNSRIAFLSYDSIVLDVDKKEKNMLYDIKSIFENTRLGNFLSRMKIGKDYGSMKEI